MTNDHNRWALDVSPHVDENDAIFRVGAFRSTLDFDPSAGEDLHTSGVYNDAYVTKTKADDSYAWTQHVGASGAPVVIEDLVVDSNDNIYVGGCFMEPLILTSTITTRMVIYYPKFPTAIRTSLSCKWRILVSNWVWKAGGSGYDKFLAMEATATGIVTITKVMDPVNFDEGWQSVLSTEIGVGFKQRQIAMKRCHHRRL